MAGVAAGLRALVGGVTAMSLLAACGGSGYDYVSKRDDGVHFKVPTDWAVFDEEQLFTSLQGQTDPLDLARARARTWFRGFDSSEPPDLTNVFAKSTDDPHGFARVQELPREMQESINLSSLRGVYLGEDPVKVKRDDPEGSVEVLRHEDIALDGGEQGVRMLLAVDTEEGIAVVDQTALLNATNSKLYLFVVGCSEACYLENQSTIEEVADSWTIEER